MPFGEVLKNRDKGGSTDNTLKNYRVLLDNREEYSPLQLLTLDQRAPSSR